MIECINFNDHLTLFMPQTVCSNIMCKVHETIFIIIVGGKLKLIFPQVPIYTP